MVKSRKNHPSKSINRSNQSNNEGKTAPVKSIFRSTRILQCLDNEIHSIKEIALNCQLSMTTVHRILQTLEESQLVFQDPVEHKYYLGPLFTQLSINRIDAHKYLLTQAYNEVLRLADLFGEFAAVDVEVGMQVLTLMQIPSRFNFSISKILKPMYYGSVSKMIMAQKSDAEIEMILNTIPPKPISKYCITEKEKIMEQFKEIRLQGYCISHREIDEGIMGISVPIKNYICAAALSIVGPEIRLEQIVDNVTRELLISAEHISGRVLRDKS